MNNLDFVDNLRARRVLGYIARQEHRLMPCSESRVATTLMHQGYLHLTDPRQREFTTAFRLTEKGREAVERYLPGTEIVED